MNLVVAGYKINRNILPSYTIKMETNIEIKETIPFTIATKV